MCCTEIENNNDEDLNEATERGVFTVSLQSHSEYFHYQLTGHIIQKLKITSPGPRSAAAPSTPRGV